jgi:hypothetical protein
MSDFYIMRAAHLASTPRKISLAKVAREEPNCTVILAKRFWGFDKEAEVFIIGSASENDYNVKAGDKSTYTIDTGNGYRNYNEKLEIEHVLMLKDGKVVRHDGKTCEPRELPEGENRHAYVMK